MKRKTIYFLALALMLVGCREGQQVMSVESEPKWMPGGLVPVGELADGATLLQVIVENLETKDPYDMDVIPQAMIDVKSKSDEASNYVLNYGGNIFGSFEIPGVGMFAVVVQAPSHGMVLNFAPDFSEVTMTRNGEPCVLNAVDTETGAVQFFCWE